MKRLRTERLVLEPVTTHNAAVLWKIMQSGHLREFQDVPRHTRDEFTRRVAARPKTFDSRALGRFEWLIVIAATAKAVGWASLRVGDQARGAAEIGYSLVATHRGAGYASEAARALVAHTFTASDLRRIDACCVPANLASRKLLRSVGFDEMRVQKNGAIVRGRPVDIVIFELTRDQWLARLGGASASTHPARSGEKRGTRDAGASRDPSVAASRDPKAAATLE